MKPRKKVLRRMGYLRDQAGIMNRYLRESSNWRDHLDRTRNFIKSSFPVHNDGKNHAGSVAVLGSGWLLDVPLDHLLQAFRKVYLVDINHPPQIKKKAGGIENLFLLEEDLSGGAIEQVWQFTSGKGQARAGDLVRAMKLTEPLSSLAPSAIISLNLLNQLNILLNDFLSRMGHADTRTHELICKNIQSFHLQWITKKPGCLITDTREISIHRDGHEEVKPLLFTPLPVESKTEQWIWDFDSTGSYRPGFHTRMEVRALSWK